MALPQLLFEDLKLLLAQTFNEPVTNLQFQPVSGGSINQTLKLTFSKVHTVFCKLNNAETFPNLFITERQSLEALRNTGLVKTPKPLAYAVLQNYQVLLLEWIESGPKTKTFFKLFGQQLATLHRQTADAFGWPNNNYMGSVPQQNEFHKNWASFLINQRLQPLVLKCEANGLLTPAEHGLFKKLYEKIPRFFDDGESPAMLHGDLWSGNFMCTLAGEPVLIDPAVYYGHRTMDIALTKMFGGFDEAFYESYTYHFPLPQQHAIQVEICTLYPLLLHLFLFGRSYLAPIQQTLRKLC